MYCGDSNTLLHRTGFVVPETEAALAATSARLYLTCSSLSLNDDNFECAKDTEEVAALELVRKNRELRRERDDGRDLATEAIVGAGQSLWQWSCAVLSLKKRLNYRETMEDEMV